MSVRFISGRGIGAIVALVALLVVAACTAFAQDAAGPPPPPVAAQATDPNGPRPGATSPAMSAESAQAYATGADVSSASAPLPGNAAIPLKWLPPGAFEQDRGPSEAVYPPQKLTLRFNHKFHVEQQNLQCKTCHANATTSESVADHLTPRATTCDGCHGTEHDDLNKVKPGDEAMGKCNFCHVGYKEGDGNLVAKFEIPRANMVFNHKTHVARNINCQQCHGEVQEIELATRDQMPRMRGCFGCHQHPEAAARGEAKGACETCHIKGGATEGGRLKTVFASGSLQPPRWLHNSQHTPDFVQRHKYVAANDSQFCANCHKEEFCTACHDGRVRPRNIHPNDYLNMHAVEGRLATQKCTSCHREQNFCLGCHQRLGVSMSGPVKDSGRFHPPKSEWSDPPRKPGHHSFECSAVLDVVHALRVRFDPAFLGAFGHGQRLRSASETAIT